MPMASKNPERGQVVRVRTRTYLVEDVAAGGAAAGGTIVRLACLDDDAQGQELEVVWELELDTEIIDRETWAEIGRKGFDGRRHFSAYIHALRWNCVTATRPTLFQSPFRAGIRLDAYQLEPLRKALQLPRVNLFIADDVGLGKTIEAGLIAVELLLRRRAREVVVVCPPSMLQQWRDELDSRFGLAFEVMDRDYVRRIREERGYGVNPWDTFPRFLISNRLITDESYAGPMRAWLDNLRPGSLLILDEAHHAAPSSGAKYAIDSHITRAVRELAPRFEHRLFLSATPHNGHSNSFSALLEILDPQRFIRGVPVRKAQLDAVMVRRLKEDIRTLEGGFPLRKLAQHDLTNLPEMQPELALSRLLEEYREVRSRRLTGATRRKQSEAALLISGLQQRLLSSVEAFARTLTIHRRTMERIWARELTGTVTAAAPETTEPGLLDAVGDREDDRSQLAEDDQQVIEDAATEAATEATTGTGQIADAAHEKALLAKMTDIAENARGQADARIIWLIAWMREHLTEGARLPGQPAPRSNAPWSDTRILIFTEYEDTRRYLFNMLEAAIAGTDRADERIAVFHGPTPPERREAIKRAFNLPPSEHPVRILVATDAAREGLNLQAHCHNVFHFDLPWNPSRLEQRNGRIDRKLQPAPIVYCHYFVYIQRPEDKVLRALVRKTDTIRIELGSLAQVIEDRLAITLREGITATNADRLAGEIENADLDPAKRATAEDELEAVRDRRDALARQIDTLRNRIDEARRWIGYDSAHFRDALSCSLEMLGAKPLTTTTTPAGTPQRFVLPDLATRHGADSSWAATLDTLRAPPEDGERGYRWRREAAIRPVVFDAPSGIDEDIVQLHLEHRLARRLLGRFLSQGFVHHDLSRACLAQSRDAVPRVILLGRLSLYGERAVRLHEEMLTVTARWVEPRNRTGGLKPYGHDAEEKTVALLEESFGPATGADVPAAVSERLLASVGQDMSELLPLLESRGQVARQEAEDLLVKRAREESKSIRDILEDQRKRVLHELGRSDYHQMLLDFGDDERRQYEANRRHWQRWIENVDGDLAREPQRIEAFYHVASTRIEPVGLVYLWPVTG